MRVAGDLDNVRRMATTGTFGVIGMDRTSANGGHRCFNKTGFVERIGMDCDLDIKGIGYGQAGVDRSGCRAPIFVQL